MRVRLGTADAVYVGRMQYTERRTDAGQDGCSTGWMQDRTDVGKARCWTGHMQKRMDAGQIGCSTGLR